MTEENREYRGPERRRNGCECVQVSEAQIALMIEEEVERRLSKAEDKLLAHMDVKFGQLHKLITDAFPDGDPYGHRLHHEAVIKSASKWEQMKGEVASKLLTGGVWVTVAWIAMAIWQSFKNEVQR